MNSIIETVEDTVARAFQGGSPTRKTIYETTRNFSYLLFPNQVSEEDVLNITRKLETRFDVSMDIGSILGAEDYTAWLDDNRSF